MHCGISLFVFGASNVMMVLRRLLILYMSSFYIFHFIAHRICRLFALVTRNQLNSNIIDKFSNLLFSKTKENLLMLFTLLLYCYTSYYNIALIKNIYFFFPIQFTCRIISSHNARHIAHKQQILLPHSLY